MNRKLITFFSVLIIIAFIGYIIFDSMQSNVPDVNQNETNTDISLPDFWKLSGELPVKDGSLKAVAVSASGNIYIGGDSFVRCYDQNLNPVWNLRTPAPVTSLAYYGDTILASTIELIFIISREGEIKDEWGPFEDNSIITSLSVNKSFIAFADAGNKMVFVLDKRGVVKSLIGLAGEKFIIPSPYFDVSLSPENKLFIANTGQRRIETRTIEGELLSFFGESGTAPEAFCGCCNPAHFISIPGGFVTAEKGINRIKVIDAGGKFVEYVSSKNSFIASIPLDLASVDGKTIYAANPADSKLYIFTRK